jgi:Ca2+-binding RTX toxin-like protein
MHSIQQNYTASDIGDFQGTPFEQLDRAQALAGSTIQLATTSSYMIGSYYTPGVGVNILSSYSIVVKGVNLTYGGGNVLSGTIHSISIMLPGSVQTGGLYSGGTLLTFDGLNLPVASNTGMLSSLRTGSMTSFETYFNSKPVAYTGSYGDDEFNGAPSKVNIMTGGGDADVLRGGDYGNLIFGDKIAIATKWGTNAASAFDLTADARFWTTEANPLVGISAPHATAVFVAEEAGVASAWYKVTVAAGARITVDIDYGEDWFGNTDTDTLVRIFEADGTTAVATATSGPVLEDGDFGDPTDATLTYTFKQAGTYYIRVSDEDGEFSLDSGFVMNVSLTKQATTALPTNGNDLLYGGNSGDAILGMGGNDEISGGNGSDELYGGAGNDTLLGGEGEDLLRGGSGDDFLQGGNGNDRLFGSGGKDTLLGGSGSDILFIESITAGSIFDGGADTDYLSLATGDGVYDLRNVTIRNVEYFVLEDYRTFLALQLGGGGGIEEFDFRDGLMKVRMNAAQFAPSSFLYMAGSTPIGEYWKTASEILEIFMADATTLNLSTTALVGFDQPRDRIIVKGDGNAETIIGSAASEEFYGSGGNDTINGADGNDIINGGTGADKMTGGAGNDTFYVDNAGDRIDETGGGTDTVRSTINFSLSGKAVTGGVEKLFLLGKAKVGTGNGKDNAIVGNGQANTLTGGSGNDTLKGAGGNDVLKGGTGNDRLEGGDGHDLLLGGAGKDVLAGGKGRDTASYQDAKTGVNANLAKPKNNKGDAAGDVYSSIENLTGSAKADTLSGSKYDNVLKGGAGNDRLLGGSGKDTLVGQSGKDILKGEGGADQFVFTAVKDSPRAKNGWDVIADFSRQQKDKINLKAMDAKTGSGNQAFDFIGKAGFSGKKGELRYETKAGKTFVYGDTNGDSKADFAIELTKAIALKGTDFIL